MFGENISDSDLLLLLVGSIGILDDPFSLHRLNVLQGGRLLLGQCLSHGHSRYAEQCEDISCGCEEAPRMFL